MSEISIRLGLIRTERGMTQQQLANAIGARRGAISALERGKTRGIEFATLARLCDALHCTPNDLLAVERRAHIVPVLGGEDEDEIIAERLAGVDLAALAADPGLGALGLFDDDDQSEEAVGVSPTIKVVHTGRDLPNGANTVVIHGGNGTLVFVPDGDPLRREPGTTQPLDLDAELPTRVKKA